jgi:hypothetical protein
VQDLQKAVARVAQGDETARAWSWGADISDQELAGLLLHRLRQHWCGGPAAAETFRLEAWLTDVAFFSREAMEIGTWAPLFHALALIHREGLAAPAARQAARHQVLRKVDAGHALESLEELVIYLEGQIHPGEAEGLGSPSVPPVDPELFPGQDLTTLCQLFRDGLMFLQDGERQPEVKGRLEWLSEHRDFIDLKDLLLAFLAQVKGKDPLPSPAEVLDLLQLQGFPMRHQDFRDEYRASLAPLAALPEAAAAALRWPLEPGLLTGNP